MCCYDKLGFAINLKKSLNVQTQRTRILGFVIDLVKRIVLLTKERSKTRNVSFNLLNIDKPTIRYLTKVIGTIISCVPAAIQGPFFYRYLENDKETSLN